MSPPFSAEEWMDKKLYLDEKTGLDRNKLYEGMDSGPVWDDLCQGRLWLGQFDPYKGGIFFYIAVMDRVGGWRFGHEECSQMAT